MIEHEIWKDIPGYEGYYQASNLGNIKSLDRTISNKRGKYLKKGKIKKLKINKYGYFHIHLDKNGERKWFAVHRLIAITFLKNPNNFPQINHKNEIKTDNRIENLEFCTALFNNTYGTRLKRVSKKNKLKKVVLKYDLNGNFIKKYSSVSEATKKNNISSISSVSCCCNGKIKQTHGYIFKFKKEVVPCL